MLHYVSYIILLYYIILYKLHFYLNTLSNTLIYYIMMIVLNNVIKIQ